MIRKWSKEKSVVDKCPPTAGRRETKKSTVHTAIKPFALRSESAFTKLNRKRIALVSISSTTRKCLSIVAVNSCGKYPILSAGDYFRS